MPLAGRRRRGTVRRVDKQAVGGAAAAGSSTDPGSALTVTVDTEKLSLVFPRVTVIVVDQSKQGRYPNQRARLSID